MSECKTYCAYCKNFYGENIDGFGYCDIDGSVTYCGRVACDEFEIEINDN